MSENQEEECQSCNYAVGIGMMLNLCNELKSEGHPINCFQLGQEIKSDQIDILSFTSQIKSQIQSTKNQESLDAFDHIFQLMNIDTSK